MRRDVVNLRIDIEESHVPVRPSPSHHRACPKPHHAEMLSGPVADHLHDITDGSCLVVVREWHSIQLGILAFQAVKRIPMQQFAHVGPDFIDDLLDTEVITPDVENLSAIEEAGKRKVIAENQDSHRQRKPELAVSKDISGE